MLLLLQISRIEIKGFPEKEIFKSKGWIKWQTELGGNIAGFLSGQYRPELSIEEGIKT